MQNEHVESLIFLLPLPLLLRLVVCNQSPFLSPLVRYASGQEASYQLKLPLDSVRYIEYQSCSGFSVVEKLVFSLEVADLLQVVT